MSDGSDMLEMQAAILGGLNAPLTIETLKIEAPRMGEIRVRIVASGICHTDLAVMSGKIPLPTPIVLGHEGAGVVEAVGPGVTKVAPGDHVVITILSCGVCAPCLSGHPMSCPEFLPLNFRCCRADGSHALHGNMAIGDQFCGQSSFATQVIAQERNVVKVPADAPLELLGPLACGVQTGAGSILNVLKVGPGDAVAIFGSGAVGLAAVMAARVAGATTIIAIDVVPSRLALALELGATHAFNGKEQDVMAEIRAIAPAGLPYSLDTTGNAQIIRQAIDILGFRGVCGILGVSPPGEELRLPLAEFMGMSKQLKGIIEGDVVPDLFIPKIIELYKQGRFPFDKLVKFYDLAQINDAIADSHSGVTIKPIIRMPS